MTLEELDRLLKKWRADVDSAQTNLYDLQKKLTYKLLAGEPGKTEPEKLVGQSQTKVAEALDAINIVDMYLPLLDKAIVEAQTKRDKEMPKLFQGGKIQEIANLLTAESIELPAVPVPLAQRGLLSASTVSRHVTAQNLLDSMVDAFSRGQAVILQVEQVWHNSQDKIDAAQKELTQLEQKVNALGSQAARNELDSAREALKNWSQSWRSDPLGVAQGLDCLDKLRQRLNNYEQDKRTATTELEQARNNLVRLKLLPNLNQNRITSLERSLSGIENTFNQGAYDQVKKLLDAWRQAAHDLETNKTTQTTPPPPSHNPAHNDPHVTDGGYRPPQPDALDDVLGKPSDPFATPPASTSTSTPSNPALDDVLGTSSKPQPAKNDGLDDVLNKPSGHLPSKSTPSSAPPATITPASPVETVLKGQPAKKKDDDPLASVLADDDSRPKAKPRPVEQPPAQAAPPQAQPAKKDGSADDLDSVLSGNAKKKPATPTPPAAPPASAPTENHASTSQPSGGAPAKGTAPGGRKTLDDLF